MTGIDHKSFQRVGEPHRAEVVESTHDLIEMRHIIEFQSVQSSEFSYKQSEFWRNELLLSFFFTSKLDVIEV